MRGVRAIRRAAPEPSPREMEQQARLELYSTRRRKVQAAVKEAAGLEPGRVTHGGTREPHTK